MDEESQAPEPQTRHRRAKKRGFVFGILAAAAMLAGGGFLAYTLLSAPASPFTAEVKENVTFPLYYPQPLPEGFTIDKKSIRGTSQAVLYDIRAVGGELIHISIQEYPKGADLDAFYDQQLADVKAVPSKNGVIKMGNMGSQLFASMTTKSSWVIATSEDKSLSDPVQDVMQAMRQE